MAGVQFISNIVLVEVQPAQRFGRAVNIKNLPGRVGGRVQQFRDLPVVLVLRFDEKIHFALLLFGQVINLAEPVVVQRRSVGARLQKRVGEALGGIVGARFQSAGAVPCSKRELPRSRLLRATTAPGNAGPFVTDRVVFIQIKSTKNSKRSITNETPFLKEAKRSDSPPIKSSTIDLPPYYLPPNRQHARRNMRQPLRARYGRVGEMAVVPLVVRRILFMGCVVLEELPGL